MKRLASIFLLILTASFTLHGQASFSAKASNTNVSQGQVFGVEFSVNERGSNFRAPDFSGFEVISGPIYGMQTQVDNRGMHVQISYTYRLRARSTGEITIGPAFIQVDGETLQTKPITISVSEKAQDEASPEEPKDVFFRVTVSDQKVYQGEPFYAEYKVYHKNNVGNLQRFEQPEFTGFYKEDISQKAYERERVEIDGVYYIASTIGKQVLIPQQAGTLKPGETMIELPVQERTGRTDVFGRHYVRTVNREFKQEFPAIEVMPLPENGRPSSFTGAVGNYNLQVNLSNTTITTDESLSLKIKLSGEGNLKLAGLPEVKFPQAFEAFDPEQNENITVGGFGMRGSKSIDYLLVPRYSGKYKIGPIEFSYFNPATGKYVIEKSEVFEIEVTGGIAPPSGEGAVSSAEKEKVDFIGKDILFIKTQAPDWKNLNERYLNSGGFFLWLILLIITTLGLIAYQQYSLRSGKDIRLVRQQKAGKMARKHLAQAKKELKQNRQEAFYQALANALWGYFSNKFNLPQSKMSKDTISEELRNRQVDPALEKQILEMMNRAEMARYTAVGGTSPQEDYEETARILTEIEKQI